MSKVDRITVCDYSKCHNAATWRSSDEAPPYANGLWCAEHIPTSADPNDDIWLVSPWTEREIARDESKIPRMKLLKVLIEYSFLSASPIQGTATLTQCCVHCHKAVAINLLMLNGRDSPYDPSWHEADCFARQCIEEYERDYKHLEVLE